MNGGKELPSGELTFCHGKSPFLMGKSTISMAIFNCKLLVHQRLNGSDFFLDPHRGPAVWCSCPDFLAGM